jgi:PAS domain S-box-containing protein
MRLRTQFIALVCAATLLGLAALGSLTVVSQTAESLAAQQRRVQSLAREITALQALTQEYVLYREERAALQWSGRYRSLQRVLAELQPGTSPSAAELRDEVQVLPELFGRLVALQPAGANEALTMRRRELLIDSLMVEIQAVSENAFQWESELQARRALSERRLTRLAVSLPASLALLFAIGATVLARRVLRPLARLQHAMAEAAAGRLVPGGASRARDEVGALSRGFDHMVAELQARTDAWRESEALLRTVTDNVPAQIAYLDHELRYRFVNRSLIPGEVHLPQQVIGRSLSEVEGDAWLAAGTPQIDAALGGATVRYERPMTVDGQARMIEVTLAPHLVDGQVRGLFALSFDITERRTQQARIERALAEKETLLKEVYHRVKNNLQVVQSLLNLQRRAVPEGPAREAFDETVQRVRAMALVHEKLYQSGNLSAVSLPDYTRDLLKQIGEATGAAQRGVRLHMDMPALETGLDSAVPFGLLLSELVINGLKHGFPGQAGGDVWVRLLRTADGVLLTVSDNGVGLAPGVDPLASDSMGLKLAAGLAVQLGGELSFRSERGVVFSACLTRL